MSDPLAKLFSKPGANGSNTVPKPHLLDAVRMDVSNRNNGVNSIFLEDSHVQTKPSIMYYGGESFIGNEYFFSTTPIIFLSSNPIQDSIKLASMRHQAPCYVANWNDPRFTLHHTTNDVNSRAHFLVDRYPHREHSFVGLVQADPMLKNQSHRGKKVQITFNGLALYSNKARKGISHPHGGYQFFFGFHNYRRDFIGHYAFRKQGATTSDNVSFFNTF